MLPGMAGPRRGGDWVRAGACIRLLPGALRARLTTAAALGRAQRRDRIRQALRARARSERSARLTRWLAAVVRRAAASAAALAQAAALAAAPLAAQPTPETQYTVSAWRVIDGDTFEAEIPLLPGLTATRAIRIRGIDAAERRARCPRERRLAQAATAALTARLEAGPVVLARLARGVYAGRLVADVRAGGVDVAAALVAAGHARPYAGGRRASWCD